MAERNTTTIEEVRERLTGLLADWGAELSLLLKELEDKRALAAEIEDAGRDEELQALEKRIESQQNLIDTLRIDSEETSKLRKEIRKKDMELERINAELDSKKELIRALRRDAEAGDRLKADARSRDRELEQLRADLRRADAKAEQGMKELAAMRDAAEGQGREEQSELESLRSELEARKMLIKSLRADQERVATLESSLEEKREIIDELEVSMNRHSGTIAELRRSGDEWKRKYLAAMGESSTSTATTSVDVPTLSDTDVRVIDEIERAASRRLEPTISEMRRPFHEVRRAATPSLGEK